MGIARLKQEVEMGSKRGRKWFWRSAGSSAFHEEARTVSDYSWFDFLHGYVYGRWIYLYIAIGRGEHWLSGVFRFVAALVSRLQPKPKPDSVAHTFADTYHGKVVTPQAARQLVTVHEDIDLGDLEQIIPYTMARDIVLKNPDHIVVLDCACRASKPDPCLPLDVCMVIGEPFASFVIDHHPGRARWITQAQAEEILAAEHERGHVHHAFFKDAMFGRFYAICNCCSCCCAAMDSFRRGSGMLASSGYVARVGPDECVACGECQEACPFGAIALDGDLAIVDEAACMGCGVCVSVCSAQALTLVLDAGKSPPLEIGELIKQADL
jgi:Pyruvate/2-oxoacid:ferredoxin oxidoreductase delta subunit